MKLRRIQTVDDLHQYLQVALQLEHTTLPPYMTALYSLIPGTNLEATRTLQAVILEEMLHITLVANVLNAVGGTPCFTGPNFVPLYPTHLPDGEKDFEVSVCGFSRDAVKTFLQIERPRPLGRAASTVDRPRSTRALLPTLDEVAEEDLHYFSIGEFYLEIDQALRRLDDDYSSRGEELFCGPTSRQIYPDFRYPGGGEIVAVRDLETALFAIRLICEQGEGLGGAIYDEEDELSHYYRFEQLLLGRSYQLGDVADHPTGESFSVEWEAVHPVLDNARLEDYPAGSAIYETAVAFRDQYHSFLALLDRALGGEPALLDGAVGEMFRIKKLALELISTEIPGGNGLRGAPIYGFATSSSI